MFDNAEITPKFGGCSHDSTVTVITAGLELVVCEGCGSVTVRYESAISGDARRSQFARKADSLNSGLHSSSNRKNSRVRT